MRTLSQVALLLIALVAGTSLTGCEAATEPKAEDASASQTDAEPLWPELPTKGFTAGRVANQADLERGDAVFLSQINGKASGAPAPIRIPQLAYLSTESGRQLRVVVVQAETNARSTVLGMRDATGKEYVATDAEVRLVGSAPPR